MYKMLISGSIARVMSKTLPTTDGRYQAKGDRSKIMENAELDRFLAEHAFGWVWVDVPVDASGQNAGRTLMSPDFHRMIRNNEADFPKKGLIGEHAYVSPYSTDPVASDALLDRMRELGWRFRLESAARSGESWLWCEFIPMAEDTWAALARLIGPPVAVADDKELAVALAAYKALGGVDAER